MKILPRPAPTVLFGLAATVFALAIVSCGGGGGGSAATGTATAGTTSGPTTIAALGQAFFFDTTLSNPPGQACATCHSPTKAFTDPRPGPMSLGAVAGIYGFRNAPSVCYMAYSPALQINTGEAGGVIGGQFWDGHANDLPSQARFPLLNPLEMNNSTVDAVVTTVKNGRYANAMKALFGPQVFSTDNIAFTSIAEAIAEYERTPQVSPFSSLYDAFLAGKAQLTASQLNGLTLFNGRAGCSGCHTSSPLPDGTPPLFTSFCYANLGLPKNPLNPYYSELKLNPEGSAYVDIGLQNTTKRASDAGNFMTPSLRNVAVTGPYFHNGLFTTLKDVVHFYNTRDLGGYGPPEVPATEDLTELGNLKLTDDEENDIVAFLGTLTDGYTAPSVRFAPKVPIAYPRMRKAP